MIFLQGSCFYLPITSSSEIQKVSQKVITSGCATIQLKLSLTMTMDNWGLGTGHHVNPRSKYDRDNKEIPPSAASVVSVACPSWNLAANEIDTLW